jgi:large subunit ribosomal protein L2
MGINKLKPVTPGTRFRSNSSFDEITKTTPEKSLTVYLTKSGGRNNHGRVTLVIEVVDISNVIG